MRQAAAARAGAALCASPHARVAQILVPRLAACHGQRIGLVVVDSLAGVVRGDFGSCRSELVERRDWFFLLASKMKELSVKHHVAFVVVNQVGAVRVATLTASTTA